MAKCTSMVWLIAIGLSFACVKADTYKKTADDIGKSWLKRLWGAVDENLESLATAYDIADEGYKFYSRVSPAYEKWNKGEISENEFGWKVGKAVVRGGCSLGGRALGTTVGAIVTKKRAGAQGGGFVGSKLGDKVGEYMTGETD